MKYRIKPLSKSIVASVAIPGSKSYTNRALIMAVLTRGPVTLHNPLFSDDTEAMIECLQKLGIGIAVEPDSIVVSGNIFQLKDNGFQTIPLHARDSGTTIRFLLALICLIPGTKILKGNKRLQERPIYPLVLALRRLGAEISGTDFDQPPLTVTSHHLQPGTTSLSGTISSQFFSALLMVSPNIGETTITVDGPLISRPYIDMTIAMMKDWGVTVQWKPDEHFRIPAGQEYHMSDYLIEGDYSSAGYFAALAALTQSQITLENLNPLSAQADRAYLSILEQMGSHITHNKNSLTITGNGVVPLQLDMEACPDQVQTHAVLAAFAEGKTHITGVRSLRVKETERVQAIQTELSKMGIQTESTEDTLTIYGGNPQPAVIDTYNDHRMAMSFALAGTKLSGIEINDPEVVKKTFPTFWDRLAQVGVTIEQT